MIEVLIPDKMILELQEIYQGMEKDYDRVARLLSFGCSDCPDNCCDSFFLHHTYVEWAYLWLGFKRLSAEKQLEVLERSAAVVLASEQALRQGERPQVMCPLNEDGLCMLYPYRLLVCRTHGVPASMTRPDGKRLTFLGCFRCQEITDDLRWQGAEIPLVERTPLLHRLAMLENTLLKGDRQRYPRVKLTIAQMLSTGPPALLF